MEKKTHLVNWKTVCLDRGKRGLRVHRLATSTKHFCVNGVGGLQQDMTPIERS